MKKVFFMSMMLLMMTGLSAVRAQNEPAQSATQSSNDQTEAIEELTKTMVKAYGLNDDQAKALLALNKKRVADLAEIDAAVDVKTANAAQKAEVKTMKAEVQANYDAMLKELFSEKQYEKYLADEAEKKEKIKGNVNWMANMANRILGENNVNLLGWNGNISDSIKIAQEATNKMTRKYKLNKEQEEKMLALNMAEVSAEIAERKSVSLDDATPTEMAEKAQEFAKLAKTRSANYERYLKEIFDEKQYKKYTNSKKAQQTRDQRFGGPGGFRGPFM